jgi:hypothetical protein
MSFNSQNSRVRAKIDSAIANDMVDIKVNLEMRKQIDANISNILNNA